MRCSQSETLRLGESAQVGAGTQGFMAELEQAERVLVLCGDRGLRLKYEICCLASFYSSMVEKLKASRCRPNVVQ